MTMIAYPSPSDLRGRLYLAAVLGHFPAATLIEARTAFVSNADWRSRWPAVLATLAGLAFMADESGAIGRGVLAEVMDAEAAGLPVWFCDGFGVLHPREAVAIVTTPDGDWARFATVTRVPTAGGCAEVAR